LFYRGISTRKVQEHLQAFYPHNSSHKTIYKWIVKYAKQISSFTDNIKLKVGSEMQIDEMEIGSRKSRHNGWFIDSIDTETRYMVSSKFAKSRTSKEIKSVLKLAKNKTGNQIKIVTSDGYNAYIEAVRFMGVDKRFSKNPKVTHKVVTQLKNEGFNIKIERLHNSVRHRIKTFRGFHGSPESANSILKGWEIYYNFIRKHQALNKCPYELATDIKLENPNKWLELIQLSNTNNLK
jgi:transposase-like protein